MHDPLARVGTDHSQSTTGSTKLDYLISLDPDGFRDGLKKIRAFMNASDDLWRIVDLADDYEKYAIAYDPTSQDPLECAFDAGASFGFFLTLFVPEIAEQLLSHGTVADVLTNYILTYGERHAG